MIILHYRVDINSEESLFRANVSLDVSNFEMKKYCDCSTETQQNENSISNHYTANCSITTQTVQCSSITTSKKVKSTCNTYQNRFKRDANMDSVGLIDESEDSDDVVESQPLHYDPNFDPNPVYVSIYLSLLFFSLRRSRWRGLCYTIASTSASGPGYIFWSRSCI